MVLTNDSVFKNYPCRLLLLVPFTSEALLTEFNLYNVFLFLLPIGLGLQEDFAVELVVGFHILYTMNDLFSEITQHSTGNDLHSKKRF